MADIEKSPFPFPIVTKKKNLLKRVTRLLVGVSVVFHDCGIHRNNTKTIRNTSNKFIMIEDPIRRQRRSQDFSKGGGGSHCVKQSVFT